MVANAAVLPEAGVLIEKYNVLGDAAIAGTGIVYLFEDWLQPHSDRGELEPVLKPWWPRFSGPFLYYPGRRLVPAPLRAFIDFIKAAPRATTSCA